ncbi:MAG: sulfatase-like hydrolase/transferase [Bacteroidetes bacterium]|nr:sulfatase-like hydrolase/transferase [Bacteroidota bacterium]
MKKMNIKKRFKFILIIVFLSLLTISCNTKKEKVGADKIDVKKPNILFLLTDDHSFNTINALGNKEVFTPNIDRLVDAGTAFTHAHIMGGNTGAICMPSRAMIMTSNFVNRLDYTAAGAIGPNEVTLPQTLKNAGYETFGTGKWHNNPPAFAKSFTDGGNIFMGGMSNHLKVPIHDFDETGKYKKDKAYITNTFSSVLFSDAAINKLKTYKKEDPFFMYVAFSSPHDPRMAPEEYTNKYKTEDISLPKNFMPGHPFDNGELIIRDENLLPFPRTEDAVKGEIASYYAMISEVDANIGRILDALEESGKADNTIVILAGDNGLAVGQHGLIGKQNLYDHSIRVPLIFKGPGIQKGVRTSSLVYLNDLYPTITELVGVENPKALDGTSLVPILNKPNKKVRESVFYLYKNFQRGVRTKDWKLIQYLVKGKKTTQLFKIDEDPLEMNNLAYNPEYKEKVLEMNVLLKEWIEKSGDKVNLDAPDWGVPVIKSWETTRREQGKSLDFKGGH